MKGGLAMLWTCAGRGTSKGIDFRWRGLSNGAPFTKGVQDKVGTFTRGGRGCICTGGGSQRGDSHYKWSSKGRDLIKLIQE